MVEHKVMSSVVLREKTTAEEKKKVYGDNPPDELAAVFQMEGVPKSLDGYKGRFTVFYMHTRR